MRHKTRVFEKFAEWSAQGADLVLAIVVGTQGSTYSKSGDFMLITGDGRYQGLLSGGCVEGDLASHAATCAATQRASVVLYDLGGDHDALWGMGAGCDGVLQIVLLPLADAAALRAVIQQYTQHQPATLAFEWDTSMVCLVTADQNTVADAAPLRQLAQQQQLASGHFFEINDDHGRGALFVPPAPRVLLCGAGADAEPLAEILSSLGWQMTVYDHRSAYVDAFPELPGVHIVHDVADALSARVPINAFDAAMVMSHHLQTDAVYLEQLAAVSDWPYIAVLGPGHRRQRLLEMLSVDAASALENVLKGPAGLLIGGREPVSIALSIAAQMHRSLAGVEGTTPASAVAVIR